MKNLKQQMVLLGTLSQVIIGCTQDYTLKLSDKTGVVSPGSPQGVDAIHLFKVSNKAKEHFSLTKSNVKKIDFFFVVDNSGSMSNKQKKLAIGFKNFANTFYRRADLDICTHIITSDRYLGRVGSKNYQRERSMECTKPVGSESWSDAQMQAHIDALISDFTVKINVGTRGHGKELLIKSLITSLYNLDAYPEVTPMDESKRTAFFRPGAFANISFVTDENNWFHPDALDEETNDLPPSMYAIYDTDKNLQDSRKGAKEYLDGFFAALNANQSLSYSVTTLLETELPYDTAANTNNLARNLSPLSELIGRGSARGNLELTDVAYTDTYASVAHNILQRAFQFTLAHDVNAPSGETIKVTLVKASKERVVLTYGSQFSMISSKGLSLDQSIVDSANAGDMVEVEYMY